MIDGRIADTGPAQARLFGETGQSRAHALGGHATPQRL